MKHYGEATFVLLMLVVEPKNAPMMNYYKKLILKVHRQMCQETSKTQGGEIIDSDFLDRVVPCLLHYTIRDLIKKTGIYIPSGRLIPVFRMFCVKLAALSIAKSR